MVRRWKNVLFYSVLPQIERFFSSTGTGTRQVNLHNSSGNVRGIIKNYVDFSYNL